MVAKRINLDDLIDADGVREALGLENVGTVYTYRRRYDDFPAPVIDRGRGSLWSRRDVKRWADKHPRRTNKPGDTDGHPG